MNKCTRSRELQMISTYGMCCWQAWQCYCKKCTSVTCIVGILMQTVQSQMNVQASSHSAEVQQLQLRLSQSQAELSASQQLTMQLQVGITLLSCNYHLTPYATAFLSIVTLTSHEWLSSKIHTLMHTVDIIVPLKVPNKSDSCSLTQQQPRVLSDCNKSCHCLCCTCHHLLLPMIEVSGIKLCSAAGT